MAASFTVKPKEFKKLEATTMKILEIYPEYRYGWSDQAKRYREFNYFPDTATAQTVYSGDEGTKTNDSSVRFHLREKSWDDTAKKFKFEKMGKLDGNFFKQYWKVFDMDVAISSEITLQQYDRELGEEVAVTLPAGSVIQLKAVSSKKVSDMAISMMLSKWVQKVKFQRKNPTTWEMVEVEDLPRDWENDVLDKMINRCFEMAVTGAGLQTKYTFVPVMDEGQFESKEAPASEITIDDVPFR